MNMQKEKEIYNQLQIDDLTDDAREIAERIGIENFRKLVQEFGGTNLYIPFLRSFPKFLSRIIPLLLEKGYSIRQVSQLLNVSQNTVRRYSGRN